MGASEVVPFFVQQERGEEAIPAVLEVLPETDAVFYESGQGEQNSQAGEMWTDCDQGISL